MGPLLIVHLALLGQILPFKANNLADLAKVLLWVLPDDLLANFAGINNVTRDHFVSGWLLLYFLRHLNLGMFSEGVL